MRFVRPMPVKVGVARGSAERVSTTNQPPEAQKPQRLRSSSMRGGGGLGGAAPGPSSGEKAVEERAMNAGQPRP